MGSASIAFKDWAVNEGLTLSGPIEQIKNTRIGIDAEDYVNSLLVVVSKERGEPLVPALGGLPFRLYNRIAEDLEQFREAEVTPVFVFGGLDLACWDKTGVFRESRKAEKLLNEAWSIYDKRDGDSAVVAFGKAVFYRTDQIVRNVFFYLHRQGVDTQTAPYSAAAQLAYLEQEGFVDAVAGNASCLLFGADKVITGFDWSLNKEDGIKLLFWVSEAKCLSKLSLTRDQFVNVCLLAGCSILPVLPEIDADTPGSRLSAARSFITRTGQDSNSLLHSLKDEAYRDLFIKARFALKHPVIATADGKIEAVDWETGPSDAHAFIGQRLPDELLAYMTFGLVSPKMLNCRTRMEVLETQPLDGGDSEAYRRLVQEKLRPLRAQTLAVMTRHLHRYYQKSDVELICYWSETTKTPLNISDQGDPAKVADSWNVKTRAMSSQPLSDASQTPLTFAVMTLANDTDAKQTTTPHTKDDSSRLRENEELTANTVWRFLEHRGYVNSDHTLSAWGKALKTSLEHAASTDLDDHAISTSEIEEAIFMAFELLRLDLLSGKEMFSVQTYSGGATKGSEQDKVHTLFVSRIACLGAFHHKGSGYNGPLSRHLLAYHQVAAAVRGALRDLVEIHACNMFMSNSVDRKLEKATYKNLSASLPFLNEPNAGLGLVVKMYLEEVLQPSETTMEEWFRAATDIEGDLQKAWKLWDAIYAGIQAADDSIVSVETKNSFKSTDKWLAQKRDHVVHAGPNGTA